MEEGMTREQLGLKVSALIAECRSMHWKTDSGRQAVQDLEVEILTHDAALRAARERVKLECEKLERDLRAIIFDHETGFHAAETQIKALEAQLAQAQAQIAELEGEP